MRSVDPTFTGKTVFVTRVEGDSYDVKFDATDSSNIANHVRHFPLEWILPDFAGITQEGLDYVAPLLVGTPVILFDEKGLPKHVTPYYMR